MEQRPNGHSGAISDFVSLAAASSDGNSRSVVASLTLSAWKGVWSSNWTVDNTWNRQQRTTREMNGFGEKGFGLFGSGTTMSCERLTV